MNIKALLIAGAALAAMTASGAQAASVVNGDFSAGNTGFGTDYNYIAPLNQGSLYPETAYTVDTNPNLVHNLWSSFGDHTTGSGEMLIVNGATTLTATNDYRSVWNENVTGLSTGSDYFSVWVASTYPASLATLIFKVNGVQVGGVQTAPATPGVWQQLTWTFKPSSSSAVLSIADTNLAPGGNDFALDDIKSGAVPEPAAWAMMIGGFGMAGAMLRRRRALSATAA